VREVLQSYDTLLCFGDLSMYDAFLHIGLLDEHDSLLVFGRLCDDDTLNRHGGLELCDAREGLAPPDVLLNDRLTKTSLAMNIAEFCLGIR